jgi:hypothetical protein
LADLAGSLKLRQIGLLVFLRISPLPQPTLIPGGKSGCPPLVKHLIDLAETPAGEGHGSGLVELPKATLLSFGAQKANPGQDGCDTLTIPVSHGKQM